MVSNIRGKGSVVKLVMMMMMMMMMMTRPWMVVPCICHSSRAMDDDKGKGAWRCVMHMISNEFSQDTA